VELGRDGGGGVRARVGRDDLVGAGTGIVLVNAVGAAPAVLGGPGSEWFDSLAKPALFPPTWVFGAVWTALFTLMGIALYLVYRRGVGTRPVRVAVALFAVQMAFNVAWTPTFFVLRDLAAALSVIGGLWVALLPTTWAFARVDRRAGALLVPYFLWVSFAFVLNYRFLALN
jgi:tryptophan-rich sensory protein